MHKYYLFDFDGTLVDSMPHWSKTMLDALDDGKVSYPDNILDIVCPLGYKGTAEYFINVLGLKANSDELVESFISKAVYNYKNIIPLKDGVKDYLLFLKSKGKSLNVLTASPHNALDPCLKRLGVFDLFDNVWSCDDFNTTKADPKIYHAVAEKLNTTVSEIAFFDDNINSIKTGKQAGAYTVGIFDKSGINFTNELKSTAHQFYESFLVAKEV